MKRQIIFSNYKGFTTDLKRTLSVRFGINVKNDQIHKYMNGDIIVNAEMTDEQYEKATRWKNEMS